MNIYTLKSQFDKSVQTSPSQSLVSSAQAWAYFKTALPVYPDEEDCEEVGFSASLAGPAAQPDENLFQIYFGRLIDAAKGHPWHTAEIDFYYRYAMDAELRFILSNLQSQDIEVALCRSEEKSLIRQKIDSVIAFADRNQPLWEAVRERVPVLSSYHFWIQ